MGPDLAFFVFFGSRPRVRPVKGGWAGLLNCPHCAAPAPFTEMEHVVEFTLYWLPLFTVRRLGGLIECDTCHHRYDMPTDVPGLPSGAAKG